MEMETMSQLDSELADEVKKDSQAKTKHIKDESDN